jgi:hypothetical protein
LDAALSRVARQFVGVAGTIGDLDFSVDAEAGRDTASDVGPRGSR